LRIDKYIVWIVSACYLLHPFIGLWLGSNGFRSHWLKLWFWLNLGFLRQVIFNLTLFALAIGIARLVANLKALSLYDYPHLSESLFLNLQKIC
jgi:hypothetical protein